MQVLVGRAAKQDREIGGDVVERDAAARVWAAQSAQQVRVGAAKKVASRGTPSAPR